MDTDATEAASPAPSSHNPLRARNTALLIGAVAAIAVTVFQFGYFDCNMPFASTLTGVVAVAGIVAAPFLFVRPGWVGKLLALGALGAVGVSLALNFVTHICG